MSGREYIETQCRICSVEDTIVRMGACEMLSPEETEEHLIALSRLHETLSRLESDIRWDAILSVPLGPPGSYTL